MFGSDESSSLKSIGDWKWYTDLYSFTVLVSYIKQLESQYGVKLLCEPSKVEKEN